MARAGNEHVPQGVAAAMHNLGVAYGEGCGEMKKDYLLACHWLKKAAKQGDPHAQVSSPILTHPHLSSRMLTYADVC